MPVLDLAQDRLDIFGYRAFAQAGRKPVNPNSGKLYLFSSRRDEKVREDDAVPTPEPDKAS